MHRDQPLAAACGQQRRLVDQVHQIGAGEAGRAAGQDLQLHIRRQRHLAHVNLQDALAADHVRVRDHDLTVETAGAQQRRVEHVGTVGGGDQDDAFIGLETVHLDQKLVQRLLALVVAAAKAGAAMAADGVDLVDEDDAGRVLLRLLEHVADPRRADTDEHLDEVRTGNGEERHIRFARDGARQQRLAGSRRSDQQHAARNPPAETLEFLRIAQEFDDLLEILLRLVDARDVLERHPSMRLGQKLRLRLAEAHRLAAAALHLSHDEEPDAENEQHREPCEQRPQQRELLADRLGDDLHVLLAQLLDIGRVLRSVGLERGAVDQQTGNLLVLYRHLADPALIDFLQECRERHVVRAAALAGALEELEQGDQQECDDHPQSEVSEIGIHELPLSPDSE